MYKSKTNRSCDLDEISSRLMTSSTAEKIQDLRQQLEEVLSSAYNKKSRKTKTRVNHSLFNNQVRSPSMSLRESKNVIINHNLIHNDHTVPADSKILAYKKFINSLTRIIHATNQDTSDSFSISACLNTSNIKLDHQESQKHENYNFLIERDVLREPELYIYSNLNDANIKRAEKTTYCRPIACNQGCHSKKILEKNLKLQLLVKKLVQAREKEKQNEAWNNYINELKNKHGYCDFCRSKNKPTLLRTEDEQTIHIIDESKLCGQEVSNLCRAREVNEIRRCTRCGPSISRTYTYTNNSYCCPMSSQGRLLMMERERGGLDYLLRPQRFFRGSSIVVEKELSSRKKLSTKSKCKSIIKSRSTIRSHHRTDIFECRAIQTEDSFESYHDKGGENSDKKTFINDSSHVDLKTKFKKPPIVADSDTKTKFNKPPNVADSDAKTKLERVTSFAEKLQHRIKITRNVNKQITLREIEKKLDKLTNSFNVFLKEMKLDKNTPNVKSAAVSCSSMCRSNTNKSMNVNSDTFSVLTKQNIICEVVQQQTHSSLAFSPCPISQDTINDILSQEKEKSDKVKKNIDNVLNNNNQCAAQISIDIPTRECSTEVTHSFCKRQESMIVEEMEPIEGEELEKIQQPQPIEKSMTIAVNTEPMGILALFRVSAAMVKQILSYVPNLNYVTYLARRQLDHSARYVCNICSASFTRPSALSDHIQEHNVNNFKECCVCRHVLDRFNHRSGLFACVHCGQMFTRAYCRELHEKACSKARIKNRSRPSLVLLT